MTAHPRKFAGSAPCGGASSASCSVLVTIRYQVATDISYQHDDDGLADAVGLGEKTGDACGLSGFQDQPFKVNVIGISTHAATG